MHPAIKVLIPTLLLALLLMGLVGLLLVSDLLPPFLWIVVPLLVCITVVYLLGLSGLSLGLALLVTVLLLPLAVMLRRRVYAKFYRWKFRREADTQPGQPTDNPGQRGADPNDDNCDEDGR